MQNVRNEILIGISSEFEQVIRETFFLLSKNNEFLHNISFTVEESLFSTFTSRRICHMAIGLVLKIIELEKRGGKINEEEFHEIYQNLDSHISDLHGQIDLPHVKSA